MISFAAASRVHRPLGSAVAVWGRGTKAYLAGILLKRWTGTASPAAAHLRTLKPCDPWLWTLIVRDVWYVKDCLCEALLALLGTTPTTVCRCALQRGAAARIDAAAAGLPASNAASAEDEVDDGLPEHYQKKVTARCQCYGIPLFCITQFAASDSLMQSIYDMRRCKRKLFHTRQLRQALEVKLSQGLLHGSKSGGTPLKPSSCLSVTHSR